jgi:hypothetical protein
MKIKMNLLFGIFFCISSAVNAQSQKEKFKEWGDIEITELSGIEVGPATIKRQLSLKDWEDPYLWYIEFNNAKYYSTPEQQAHPNFLTIGNDWGNDSMLYFIDFRGQGGVYYNSSIVIIDDLLYCIKENEDHSWKVEDIFSRESFKGIKGMMKLEKKRKELAKIDHDKVVNDFMKKESETLASKSPAFKENHKEYFERFKLEKGWAEEEIKEGYEELYRQRVSQAVRIQNNKPYTVYIGFNGAGSVPDDEISPGDVATIQCNLADIWLLSGKNGSAKSFLLKPSEWCGNKYIIE